MLDLNRRQALSLIGRAGLSVMALSTLDTREVVSAQGAGPPPEMKDIRATRIDAKLQQLAPNVFAYVQTAGPGQSNFLLSNCGVVAGAKALLAIDATAAPIQAKNFVDAAMKATGKRFDRLVITHSHPDHTLGAQALGDVEIISQEQCRVALEMQSAQPKPGFWNALPGWAVGDESLQRLLPNVTYTDRISLYSYGAGEVRLFWPGRAHTTGDTVVHLIKEKIAFIGDVGFFNVTPLNGGGYVADWIKACDRLLAMDIDTFVPGHGPVGNKKELTDMRDYLSLIYSEAKRRFDAGMTPGRAASEIPLGKYATWTDADRVLPNVVRLYSEFDGTITPGPPNREAIAQAQREYDSLRPAKRSL